MKKFIAVIDNLKFSLSIKWLVLISLQISLVGCGYLIKPHVQTGIAHLKKGAYSLDVEHTSVLFKVNHMGMSTFVGRFDAVDAALEFDPQNMANAKLSSIITVASVDVNNKSLEDTLRSADFFEVDKYPQAFFKTTSVQIIDTSRAKFIGDLTLHGITAPVVLDVVFNGGGDNMLTGHYTIGFTAVANIKRSQFGMGYLVPAVGDDVGIEVFAEFQKN